MSSELTGVVEAAASEIAGRAVWNTRTCRLLVSLMVCRITIWTGILLAGLMTLRNHAVGAGEDNSEQVYERVLASLASANDGMLLVLDPTVQIGDEAIERGDPSSISRAPGSPERLERLRTLSQVPISLAKIVRDREGWVVLSKDEQSTLHVGTPKAVEAIRAAYPRVSRLIRMSRAYVAAGGDEALIYVEEYGNCDSPCGGSGMLISLRRSPDGWVVGSQETVWRGHWRG